MLQGKSATKDVGWLSKWPIGGQVTDALKTTTAKEPGPD